MNLQDVAKRIHEIGDWPEVTFRQRTGTISSLGQAWLVVEWHDKRGLSYFEWIHGKGPWDIKQLQFTEIENNEQE